MAVFAPLCLPVGCAAIGNTRALATGISVVLTVAYTPAVSELPATIAALASGDDQPRKQLHRLLGIVGQQRLKLRAPEGRAGLVMMIALNVVGMDRTLHTFRPAHDNRPSRPGLA